MPRHLIGDRLLSFFSCLKAKGSFQKPNGRDQRVRPVMLVVVEALIGRAPLHRVLGASLATFLEFLELIPK